MNKIACIVGGVEQSEYVFPAGAYVIAADKGYAYLKKRGIAANLVIGDFDSLGFVPEGENTLRYPVEKDDTDTMLAVREGLDRGYRLFLLYGCAGGTRLAHTLANLQALAFIAEHGAHGFMFDGDCVITAIQNSKMMFDAHESGYISVFCMGEDAQGVDIKGLKYQVTNCTLSSKMPLGVSNEFVGKASFVSVKKGTLYVLWHKDTKQLLQDLSR